MAKPLERNTHKKFADIIADEEEEMKKLKDPHKLPEPKNLELLQRLAAPLPKNVSKKFEAILAEEKEAEQKQKEKEKEKLREKRRAEKAG